MTRLNVALSTVSIVALSTLGAACGDSSDVDSALITVDEGGTLELGDTTVTIPSGALTSDVEITLSTAALTDYPALEGADERVIVFEPAVGLSMPAELVIRPQQAIPVDGFASVRIFTDGVWISPDVSAVTVDGELNTALPFLGAVAVVVSGPST